MSLEHKKGYQLINTNSNHSSFPEWRDHFVCVNIQLRKDSGLEQHGYCPKFSICLKAHR